MSYIVSMRQGQYLEFDQNKVGVQVIYICGTGELMCCSGVAVTAWTNELICAGVGRIKV